ncbi:c-type cytochrome [Massilia glaciei]|uniref:Cytochrome C n=1 Tax=Massilia glaciei TaxID=1524097 RepID=A0A2U2HEC9_9BURK|nr:c-type cytochrome [Massilia glaciei]PWF41884.1 cytochrome C [Massilia glaciei]
MNIWLKRSAVTFGMLGAVALATVLLGKHLGERKMQRVMLVSVEPVEVLTDGAHIAQGRYLFNTRGCASCHGANGAGLQVMKDEGLLVVAPNITGGAHSAISDYNTSDWVRTLRHGVKPNGNPVMIMPSEDFNRLSNTDLGSLLGFVQQLPPVAGRKAVVELPVKLKLMYAFGMFRDASQKIDHSLPPAAPVLAAASLEHGAYVANNCISCHGATLNGGRIAGSPASWPDAANLTPGPGGVMARYPTAAAFMAMLRSGKRPDGSAVNQAMPFDALGEMNDTDVAALHMYLASLPPRTPGGN